MRRLRPPAEFAETILDAVWFFLVLAALLILGVVVRSWLLLPVSPLVVMIQWQVATPAPDDDVARAVYWLYLVPYTVALVIGILAGKVFRQPRKPPEISD